MESFVGKTALVTGAASGIGRATALALAAEGVGLALCDVDADGLAKTKALVSERVKCLAVREVDVSKREQMAAFAEEVHAQVPALDIVVNNAGVYLAGGFLDLGLEDWEWVLSVNLWGVIHGCHFFVPPMVKRQAGGHVVNVSSMFGYWASPDVIGYLTGKFAVFGFSEALREDLRDTGIAVSTVCPGVVQTGLVQNMRIRNRGDGEGIRSNLAGLYRHRNYAPENVARVIVNAIKKRHNRVVLASAESQVMYRVQRLFPGISRFVARTAARRMFRVPEDE